MTIDIFQDDKTRKKYYVFDRKIKPNIALPAIARHIHQAATNLQVVAAWVLGDELYLKPTKGALKMSAVFIKGAKK